MRLCAQTELDAWSEKVGDEAETDSGESSSSLSSWDSDSEADFGHEPSLTEPEDEQIQDIHELKVEVEQSCGDRKRRRLAAGVGSRHGLRPSTAARRAAVSEGTLIVLDWDDTLLPSTWLQQQGLQITAGSALPSEEQKAELSRVARCVIKTLRRAKRLGHVIVVTNAEKGWVELSCRKFLPEVAPLLEGVKVLSARALFEPAWPQSPIQWKRLAFHREVSTFFQGPSKTAAADIRKNVVSVGDSLQERTALLEATDGRHCWAKSLKLLERPSVEQLVKQHDLFSACVRAFTDYEGSLDLCLSFPN